MVVFKANPPQKQAAIVAPRETALISLAALFC